MIVDSECRCPRLRSSSPRPTDQRWHHLRFTCCSRDLARSDLAVDAKLKFGDDADQLLGAVVTSVPLDSGNSDVFADCKASRLYSVHVDMGPTDFQCGPCSLELVDGVSLPFVRWISEPPESGSVGLVCGDDQTPSPGFLERLGPTTEVIPISRLEVEPDCLRFFDRVDVFDGTQLSDRCAEILRDASEQGVEVHRRSAA